MEGRGVKGCDAGGGIALLSVRMTRRFKGRCGDRFRSPRHCGWYHASITKIKDRFPMSGVSSVRSLKKRIV